MSHGIAFLVYLWFLSVGWAGLPLLPPEVCFPRVISEGDKGSVPLLPWRWMTWNLQWFPGHHPQSSLEAQSQHIQSVSLLLGKRWPQVAVLQEVLNPGALQRATPGYPWRAMTDFQRAGDEEEKLPPQNIALISQWPWSEVWVIDFHRLPLAPDRPVRGFLGALFQDDQGRKITVYGVHLKSNRGGREGSAKRRVKAIDYLRWDWQRRGLDPERDAILLGGDFNCSTRNPEFTEDTIRALVGGGWALADRELGWPEGATVKPDPAGRFPAADFDHFLLSPGWLKVLGGEKPQVRILSGENIPSDHYPVELILRANSNPSAKHPVMKRGSDRRGTEPP